jgi:WS/DGAT/MGAT family acyltransferase
MRALTSLDSMFIAAEDGRTVANVCSLAIMDRADVSGKPLTRRDIQDLFAERLHLLPPLRWRLVDVPLGLGHPWWVDSGSDVDLDFHVRETAVVSPGDQDALETLVARLSAQPMDRARPLWEVYLIHGLQDDRVALLTKLHHAAVDGLSGGEVLNVIFDTAADGRHLAPAAECRREQEPGQLGMLVRAIVGTPRRQLQTTSAARRTLTNVDQVATLRSVPALGAIGRAVRRVSAPRDNRAAPEMSTPKAPRLSFNGRITPNRRVAFSSVALDDVKAIKTHFETTVNDVVVALCAGALRRWLTDRGELPDQPLVAAIPVSVRAQSEFGTYGNMVGTMLAPLPTDEPEPVARLRRCRTELRAAKKRHQSVPPSLMRDVNDLIPPIMFDTAVRAMTGIAASEVLAPVANLVVSNVPGPRTPLYCAGRLIREHYPVSAVSDSLGLNVTVFSYVDRLEIGLVGDRDLVADLSGLADAFEQEMLVLMQSMRDTERSQM